MTRSAEVSSTQRGLRGARAALVVLLLFAGLEGGARLIEVFVPPLEVDHGLGFLPSSRVFVPADGHPEQRVTNPNKTAFVANQLFEARKPQGVYRIVALGESSVNYLDPEFRILEKRLSEAMGVAFKRVEIINCGGLSHGSQRLVLVLSETLHYEPDLVLLYLGHNEFEEIEQLDLANLHTTGIERFVAHSALYRVLRDVVTRVRIRMLRAEHNARILARDRPDVARAWRHTFTAAEVEERMRAFRENVAAMLRMCRMQGVAVIVGTVPSNLVRPYLPAEAYRRFEPVWGLYDRGRYAEGVAVARKVLRETIGRHQSSDTENGILRELARENGVPLADVEQAVLDHEPHGVPGTTLFEDHCHLNDAGNELWRETYEPLVLKAMDERSRRRGTR